MCAADFSMLDDFPAVSVEQWREVIEKDLKGAPFDKKLISKTYDGIAIQPLYSASDHPEKGDASGFPGFSPFTRGGNSSGAVEHGWDIQQVIDLADPAEANKAILEHLRRGVTSIVIRFDEAFRKWYDPTCPEARDFVGKDGIMIYSVDDLDRVLKDVLLDAIEIVFEAGGAIPIAAAMYRSLLERRGVAPDRVRGGIVGDVLGLFAETGELMCAPGDGMARLSATAKVMASGMPNFKVVCVDTGMYHNAGATSAQDLAYAMATGIEYLRAMEKEGMSIAEAASQIRFRMDVGCQVFQAIAKLRAARKLWARILEASGASEDARIMHLTARSGQRVMTKRDPWVNMLRNTVCCFAGAAGGADAVVTLPFDTRIGTSDEFSQRIARNTQVILHEEANLHRSIDPSGGSWFIEHVTDELATKAWEILQKVEAEGGMEKYLVAGKVAGEIAEAWSQREKNLARRKDPVTGVSEFPNLDEKPIEKTDVNIDALSDAAVKQLDAVSEDVLTPLKESLSAGEPTIAAMFPKLVEVVANGATPGMIRQVMEPMMRPVRINPLPVHHYAEAFEMLRDASDAYKAKTGSRPKIFLANMGPIAHHTARAMYSSNFFNAGGFEVVSNNGFENSDAAAGAFGRSGVPIAVICSSDKLYETMVADVAPKLKAAGAATVVLAGRPGDNEQAWRDAGVDRFIYLGCDVLGTLQELLAETGAV